MAPPYLWRLVLLIMMALPAPSVQAHKPSDSYLRVSDHQGRLTIEWDIALKDLEFLVGLDADGDGCIRWSEVKAQQDAITAHALSRLKVAANEQDCYLQLSKLLVTQHSDGCYAVLALDAPCPTEVHRLSIRYNLLFDADPTHRGLIRYSDGPTLQTHVLSPANATLELRRGDASPWRSFLDFVREGVWHIWIGYDHILFLLALLLPAVLVWRDKEWQAVEDFRPTFRSVLKIVTVFTLAHSLTLWLAVVGYVSLPSRLVEATIAISIVFTAVHHLYPLVPLSSWLIAFVFGLIHGFGFASVLVDLGLSAGSMAWALLGFNVGVELGQMVIVMAFLPLAFLARHTAFYRQLIFRIGSMAVAFIGVVWVIERIGNVEILGI